MNKTKEWVGFGVVAIMAITSGCMRYDSDLEFSHNLTAQITEKGPDGSEVYVKAEYKDWGAGSGPDKIYGTTDDDLTRYLRVARDSVGKLQGVTYSESPGPDLQWFTSDDVVVPVARASMRGDKEVWTFAYPNLKDAPAIILDDPMNPPSLRRPAMDSAFQAFVDTATRTLASSGNNFGYQWDLPDRSYGYPEVGDIDAVYVKSARADGFEIRAVLSIGPDKIGGTDDDVLGAIWRLTRSGTSYSIINFDQPGNDQIWDTQDDNVSYAKFYQIDVPGGKMVEKSSIDAGADNIRFTDDDIYSSFIERRTWRVGTLKYTSIHSDYPAGSRSVLMGGQLVDSETILYIFDSDFIPKLWVGPTEVYLAFKIGSDISVQHFFVTRGLTPSSLDYSGVSFSHDFLACIPNDMVTLSPCVESPGDLTFSASISNAANLRRIGDDTVRSVVESPYRGDVTFGASFVRVDRVAQ